MANTEAPGDVELGNGQTLRIDPPAPPTVLEHARLERLDLFRTELQSGNHPLYLKAGRAVHFNRTPLHLAAMEGHEKTVEFILSRPEVSKAVVNAKDCFGYTPLHLAVRHSQENVVRLLTTSSLVLRDRFLAATSEPDDLGWNCGGYTPLHFAARRGDIAIAKLLLRQPRQVEFSCDPVNILALTWSNSTPLDLTREKNFQSLGDFLEASDLNWLQQEKTRTATSANAILVGATLVAASAFSAWLQPPGRVSKPESEAPSRSPSAPLPSPISDQTEQDLIFFASVALAFASSMVSLVFGIWATFPYEGAFLKVELRAQRRTLNFARSFLLLALGSLVFAFVCASILNSVGDASNYGFIIFFPEGVSHFFLSSFLSVLVLIINQGVKMTLWYVRTGAKQQ